MVFAFFSKKKDPVAQARAEAEARPDDPRAALSLASALKAAGDAQVAATEFLRAAELYQEQGFLPRALAAVQQAVQASPESSAAWSVLADLHAARRHKEDEREALKKLAQAFRAEGRSTEAAEVRNRIAALGPGR